MSLITFLLRSSWKMMAIAIITGFLSGGSAAGLLAIVGRSLSQPAAVAMVGSFVGLAIIALITSIISQVVLVRLSHHAVFQLRMQLLRQILNSHLGHLEQLGSPRLWAALTEDVQAVADAMFFLPFLCMDLAVVVGCFIYISWLSWTTLLLVFVLIAVALISFRNLFKKAEQLLTLAREEEDHLFKYFRTTTEGIKELKLHYHRRQAFLNEDVEPSAKKFRQYNIQGMTLFAVALSWGKLLFFFAIGFVLFALPKIITLSPQALSGYVLTFTYLMMPIENIINCLPPMTRANIALQKIETLGLSLSDRAELSIPPPALNASWQTLKLHNVVYPYTKEEDKGFTIGPINLTFYPGEMIFIVGGNGSGKSTLAKLVTGLYTPEAGSIMLDDQPINAQNREWYRQHFSVVFADFYLFERFLGLERPELDTIAQDYLSKLQLNHKVTVTNGKLSTTALSQGQRKRLALMTAYLEDRPIYLFDEWAADQDPEFKDLFYQQFLPQLTRQGKTVLVISHDDRYFHLGDRLIKLDNGQLDFDRPLNH